MRTTVTFDPDVAALVEQRRRERHVGLSEAVNGLLREAARVREPVRPFVQRTHALGLEVDVRNVARALEEVEGPEWR